MRGEAMLNAPVFICRVGAIRCAIAPYGVFYPVRLFWLVNHWSLVILKLGNNFGISFTQPFVNKTNFFPTHFVKRYFLRL